MQWTWYKLTLMFRFVRFRFEPNEMQAKLKTTRHETKRNETTRNETKRNETNQWTNEKKRNEMTWNEAQRNETERTRSETKLNKIETKWTKWIPLKSNGNMLIKGKHTNLSVTSWNIVKPKEAMRYQSKSNDTEWHYVRPSGVKCNQVNPTDITSKTNWLG